MPAPTWFSIPGYRMTYVCVCSHMKRDHYCTKPKPQGPCFFCNCATYTPEPVCLCGHGKKAHPNGGCRRRYCICTEFREEKAA
jgi:hypothetical protein